MERFRSAFTQNHLIAKASTVCVAGNPTILGEYVVPAGELVAIGYGKESGQESAQGRIFIDLQAAAAAANGVIRISAYSPQNRPKEIMKEFRTETLRQNETDRTKQVPFAQHDLFVSEDKKIVLEFIADADVTIDKSKTKVLFDITKQVF